MKALLCKPVVVSVFCLLLVLSLWVGQGAPCYAQAQVQSDAPPKVAALHDPLPTETNTNSTAPAAARPPAKPDPDISLDIAKELAVMKARIEQLEAELKSRTAPAAPAQPESSQPATAAVAVPTKSDAAPTPASANPAVAAVQTPSDPTVPAKKEKIAPFSDWDWTWLNGNPRNKDTAFDTKFFTPEIRADVTYNYDFNKPIDNSMGGSSELFRTNEIQLEQLGLGGDFHYDNVRARFMTQFGMYSTTTVRNDPSYAKGQWNLNEAHRDLAEAYGGYHIDALNGINIDAGIFLSYIGLFSYYNFDNWAYQASYVSLNTPWFFEGMRVQIFPTAHLKIEPWLINGWQSYGRFNGRMGVGGQVLWRPTGNLDFVWNTYALGQDTLGTHRTRYHEDDSMEWKEWENPNKAMHRMA